MYYRIIEEPKEDVYRQLIDLAFKVSDRFQLVLRKDMMSNVKRAMKSYESILSMLEPSLIERKEASEWASTILLRSDAFVYEYRITDEAREVVESLSDSLYGWIQPDLPEDLAFLKEGKAWLTTSSHEGWCVISPENTRSSKWLVEKLMTITGLKLEKVED